MFATVPIKETGKAYCRSFWGVAFETWKIATSSFGSDGSTLMSQGYTGSLMVEHFDALLSMQPESKRHLWGVAGRNLGKLQRLGKL